MSVGEDIQISRKSQTLLPTKAIHSACGTARMLSLALFFDLADLLAQPVCESLFQFQLCATAVEIIDRLASISEWNKPARGNLIAEFAGNEPHQQTLGTWMWPGRIAEIETGRRILKYK